MTENPRTSLLQRARYRTIAIALGALISTGVLTAAVAYTQAAGDGSAGTDPGSGVATGDDEDGGWQAPESSSSGIRPPSDQSQSQAQGGSNAS